MSTKPTESVKAMRNLKKPVTRGELATLLSDWAKAADASLTVKMEQMREEIVAELRVSDDHGMPERAGELVAFATAPADNEGAE